MERITKLLLIIINLIIIVIKILCVIYNIFPIYKILKLKYLNTHIILGIMLFCILITLILNIYNILKKNKEEEFSKIYNFKIIVYSFFTSFSIYLFILDSEENYPKILTENIYMVCSIVFIELFLLCLLNSYISCFTKKNKNQILPF